MAVKKNNHELLEISYIRSRDFSEDINISEKIKMTLIYFKSIYDLHL